MIPILKYKNLRLRGGKKLALDHLASKQSGLKPRWARLWIWAEQLILWYSVLPRNPTHLLLHFVTFGLETFFMLCLD